jgi:hypothetical protein
VRHDFQFSIHRGAALAGLLLLAGCASFSPDGGLGAVNVITAPAVGRDAVALCTPEDAVNAAAQVKTLLRKPLTADRAVQIALLSNRDLQAAFNTLGLSEAASSPSGALGTDAALRQSVIVRADRWRIVRNQRESWQFTWAERETTWAPFARQTL